MTQVYNFSAGPAMLPVEVLRRAGQELTNWKGLGTSVMEISHRSKEFIQVAHEAENDVRDLLAIPANYKILFCHGGARAQFAAVPLNLLGQAVAADYIDGGYWAHSAMKEAQKYCTPRVTDVRTTTAEGKRAIMAMRDWAVSDKPAYIHYCPNETIDGLQMVEEPDFGGNIVVADMSSVILSRRIDVSRYGVIYAGAQKNIGPAGITLVIVREDLLDRAHRHTPSILNYRLLFENDSMFNTPPTFAWYLSGLVFKWLKEQGGLDEVARMNQQKAALLYQVIDDSDFYHNDVAQQNRSLMNVPFRLADPKLDARFLDEAFASGLHALKGHRAVGGMRASIYNAMPLAGVQALTMFMKDFERRYG